MRQFYSWGEPVPWLQLSINFQCWALPLASYWDLGAFDFQILCFYFSYRPAWVRRLGK